MTSPEELDENPCLTFFEENAENKDKVKVLQKHPRLGEFENLKASRLSPGVVERNEELLRQVFSPQHVELDTGKLKPTAFDDASDKGLSVDRLAHAQMKDTIAAGEFRAAAARTPRQLFGIAKLNADAVRALGTSEIRYFGIYDTALADNLAHADVCQLVTGKQQGRSARSHLVDLAREPVAILREPGPTEIVPNDQRPSATPDAPSAA